MTDNAPVSTSARAKEVDQRMTSIENRLDRLGEKLDKLVRRQIMVIDELLSARSGDEGA